MQGMQGEGRWEMGEGRGGKKTRGRGDTETRGQGDRETGHGLHFSVRRIICSFITCRQAAAPPRPWRGLQRKMSKIQLLPRSSSRRPFRRGSRGETFFGEFDTPAPRFDGPSEQWTQKCYPCLGAVPGEG